MALSGYVDTETYKERYYRLNWSIDSSRKLSWTITAKGSSGYVARYGMTAKIAGKTVVDSDAYKQKEYGGDEPFSGSFTLADSTNSFTVSITAKIYSSSNSSSGSDTFTITSYTITYDANGGSAVSSQTKYYGVDLTLRGASTKTGHTFSKWNTKADGSGTSYNASSTYTANSAATLYAIWNANTYTITYNANGGSLGSVPSSQSYTYASTGVTYLSAKEPVKTGYTFLGWSLSNTATSATYTTGQYWNLSNANNYTLYAVWSENKLTVNYYSNNATFYNGTTTPLNTVNGGNVLVYYVNYYYDNSYNDGLLNYTNGSTIGMLRVGYTATGNWGTSVSGGTLVGQNTSFNNGQALAQALGKDLSSGSASVDVYAQWDINTYTINYNANGGNGNMNPQTVEWNSTFTLSNSTFKRDGYKLIGWNSHRDKDNTWYVYGKGWLTEDEIIANGYDKRLYKNQHELLFDESWIRGDEYSISEYTMYAIWEISGVVYIDNGISFEPYLAYIDNGTNWDLYLMYVDDGANWNIIS